MNHRSTRDPHPYATKITLSRLDRHVHPKRSKGVVTIVSRCIQPAVMKNAAKYTPPRCSRIDMRSADSELGHTLEKQPRSLLTLAQRLVAGIVCDNGPCTVLKSGLDKTFTHTRTLNRALFPHLAVHRV